MDSRWLASSSPFLHHFMRHRIRDKLTNFSHTFHSAGMRVAGHHDTVISRHPPLGVLPDHGNLGWGRVQDLPIECGHGTAVLSTVSLGDRVYAELPRAPSLQDPPILVPLVSGGLVGVVGRHPQGYGVAIADRIFWVHVYLQFGATCSGCEVERMCMHAHMLSICCVYWYKEQPDPLAK